MTNYTPEEQKQLGDAHQAAAELRQTDAAFATIRAEMLEAIARSALGESVIREKLYMGVNMLDRIKASLETLAMSGEMIEHNVLMRDLTAE